MQPRRSVNAHAGRRETDTLCVVAQEGAILIDSEVLHGLGIGGVHGVVTSIERLEYAGGLRSTVAQVRVYVVNALCVQRRQSEYHCVPFQGTPAHAGRSRLAIACECVVGIYLYVSGMFGIESNCGVLTTLNIAEPAIRYGATVGPVARIVVVASVKALRILTGRLAHGVC